MDIQTTTVASGMLRSGSALAPRLRLDHLDRPAHRALVHFLQHVPEPWSALHAHLLQRLGPTDFLRATLDGAEQRAALGRSQEACVACLARLGALQHRLVSLAPWPPGSSVSRARTLQVLWEAVDRLETQRAMQAAAAGATSRAQLDGRYVEALRRLTDQSLGL